jgi:predicted double-glycine peptidase
MSPWVETLGVITLAALGFAVGRICSRLPRPWWTIGYFLPLLLIVLIGLAHRFRTLEFVVPFTWLMAGRMEFILGAFVCTLVLTTPLSRLPKQRDRMAIGILMTAMVGLAFVPPFMAPALNRHTLAALPNQIDADGVCRQSTDYTCGPAAAVTALRLLDLDGTEGDLAILARTSNAMGTPPDLLARALRQRYAADGLEVEYRPFQSVADLDQPGYTLALVKFSFLMDHYVVVVEVSEDTVTVADPLTGLATLSHEDFARIWRRVGIVLSRPILVSPR